MGVPVVATTVSAIPELVRDGETGLLVPPGDPAKLGRAAARLLTEDRLRREIIGKARERVMQHFNSHDHIRRLADIYRHEVPQLAS